MTTTYEGTLISAIIPDGISTSALTAAVYSMFGKRVRLVAGAVGPQLQYVYTEFEVSARIKNKMKTFIDGFMAGARYGAQNS